MRPAIAKRLCTRGLVGLARDSMTKPMACCMQCNEIQWCTCWAAPECGTPAVSLTKRPPFHRKAIWTKSDVSVRHRNRSNLRTSYWLKPMTGGSWLTVSPPVQKICSPVHPWFINTLNEKKLWKRNWVNWNFNRWSFLFVATFWISSIFAADGATQKYDALVGKAQNLSERLQATLEQAKDVSEKLEKLLKKLESIRKEYEESKDATSASCSNVKGKIEKMQVCAFKLSISEESKVLQHGSSYEVILMFPCKCCSNFSIERCNFRQKLHRV